MVVSGEGYTMTVDGVEWPMVFGDITVKIKENDMITVKVGDVWEDSDGDLLNVVKIMDDVVAVWYINDADDLCGGDFSLDYIRHTELIERNGEKVSAFEDGAWYPVYINDKKVIRCYDGLSGKMRNEQGRRYRVEEYDWIGEKINLEDLK